MGYKATPDDARQDVLVVEDDVDFREALADFLKSGGYSVCQAANGLEALDHLRSGCRPRLILLDLRMPVMDGWRFCSEQAQDPVLSRIPVAVLSGTSTRRAMPHPIRQAGFLRKPADPEKLLATVRSFCTRDDGSEAPG
jgi:CheY-like chemotaxis protein